MTHSKMLCFVPGFKKSKKVTGFPPRECLAIAGENAVIYVLCFRKSSHALFLLSLVIGTGGRKPTADIPRHSRQARCR